MERVTPQFIIVYSDDNWTEIWSADRKTRYFAGDSCYAEDVFDILDIPCQVMEEEEFLSDGSTDETLLQYKSELIEK